MLTLDLPFPPSMNHYWRHQNGRHHISDRGKAYRATVVAEALRTRLQRRGGAMTGRLAVLIEAQMPDRRKRDLDNLPKPLLDALTHAGIWLDDEQIDDLHIIRGSAAKPGRVIVMVSEL